MNIRMDEDPLGRNAQGIKIYHEVFLLMKFLQIKHQVNNTNFNSYDLYYTVIKTRDEKEIVDNQYENGFITPNQCIGIKNVNVILRWKRMRSVLNDFEYS